MNSFSSACRAGNFYDVMATLKANPTMASSLLKLTGDNRWNCLQWAAWHSHVECMKFLLKLKELDVNAKETGERSVLHIALLPKIQQVFNYVSGRFEYPRHPSYEIVKMLLEAAVKRNDVSCFDGECPRNLAIALMRHHLDVVKLLIDCTAFLRFSKNVFWHTAAIFQRVDCMRYLLRKRENDLKVRNPVGWQPCFLFIQSLLTSDDIPSREDIKFCVELLLLTVESPADTVEVYFMLLDCFRYKDRNVDERARIIFTEIVKLLIPHHPIAELIDKILHTRLQSFYTVVTLILFDKIKGNIENCKLTKSVVNTYLENVQDMKLFFLQELFMLYTANESLFNEYIAEAVEIGLTFDKFELDSLFRVAWTQQTTKQDLFNFMKSLISNKFTFITSRPVPPPPPFLSTLPQSVQKYRLRVMNDFLLNVFVPLSNFVNAPIDLMKILRWVRNDRQFNFNESENCVEDYVRLISERNANQSEVVSLKNLSRMSVRKMLFENSSHYEALSTMYSLDIPMMLKQFLCYNHSNLMF